MFEKSKEIITAEKWDTFIHLVCSNCWSRRCSFNCKSLNSTSLVRFLIVFRSFSTSGIKFIKILYSLKDMVFVCISSSSSWSSELFRNWYSHFSSDVDVHILAAEPLEPLSFESRELSWVKLQSQLNIIPNWRVWKNLQKITYRSIFWNNFAHT